MEELRRAGIDYLEGEKIEAANTAKLATEQLGSRIGEMVRFECGGDVREVAKAFGGRIRELDLSKHWWANESGSVFVHGPEDFDIALPDHTSPLRDNFTVAHEIGHFVLHADFGEKRIIAYRKGSTRIEWEANWFAAGLLMPETDFSAAIEDEGRENISALARRFNVSVVAAEVRRDTIESRR
jgi:hypothetical protein